MVKKKIHIGNLEFPCYSVNTLVIGSGAAALNAAVSLYDMGQEDILIATEKLGSGTSNNAGSDKQTYYKLSLEGAVKDSPYDMAADLFNGGCMHGDIALCEAQHSAQAFYHLVSLGVQFPHDRFGGFTGYKTDHDQKSRATSAGPLTSRMMFEALAKDVKQKNIPVLDGLQVISLITEKTSDGKKVIGAAALDSNNLNKKDYGLVIINAVNIILGTGGPAGMYKTSVYPESQTGSSGLAFKAGAAGQNLTESQFGIASTKFRWNLSGSYQQVIPRYISTEENGTDEKEFLNEFFPDLKMLAGAIFRKGYQWPFDPRKILDYGSSLIDVLVYRETVVKGRRVFLDFRRNPEFSNGQKLDIDLLDDDVSTYLKNSGAIQETPILRLQHLNNPAYKLYKNNGIDIAKENLEIAVCAQHNNGGLQGNIWWESNIKHLFPVGEVNGTHGVYRPGGSSLNSGQVGGLRAAMYISKRYTDTNPDINVFQEESHHQLEVLLNNINTIVDDAKQEQSTPESVLNEIQERMSAFGAHIRKPDKIETAAQEALKLYNNAKDKLFVTSVSELPFLFKVLDLCLTHVIYLEAIREYTNNGGKSRGSYLVLDPEGVNPCAGLEEWRFSLEDREDKLSSKILEVLYDNESLKHNWADIRPLPEEDNWFENIWKDYREDKIIK